MPIKILQIGAGIRGKHWLKFIQEHPDTVTVACVDSDPQALDWVRNTYGNGHCECFSDLETALGKVSADAALITSPSFLHAEHAIKALQAGVPVMIEKPFACNVNEARRIIEQANASRKPVVVAENFRFVPAERTVRKLVQDGLIGEVSNVTFVDRRRMPSHTQGPWMASMDYSQLQEIAVHHFDSLRSFFCRRPLNVFARVWNPPGSDYRHGACTEALIEMERGLHIQYVGSLTAHRFEYRVSIEGEDGVIWTNRKFVLLRKRGQRFYLPVRPVKVPKGDEAPFPKEGSVSLLNSLRDAIQLGREAETSGQDNIWTIAMVEAAMSSDKIHRVVSIDEVLPQSVAAELQPMETSRDQPNQGLAQSVHRPAS
jgi:predicted dehydrogenase